MNISRRLRLLKLDAAAMVNISNFKFYVNDFSLEFQFQSFLEEIFQVGQQQNRMNVFC